MGIRLRSSCNINMTNSLSSVIPNYHSVRNNLNPLSASVVLTEKPVN